MILAVPGPHPNPLPLWILLGAVLAFVVALVVVLILDKGPGPVDVALGYEQAWDNLDFATLWTLSAPELRDGRSRDAFVRDKHAAYRAGSHLRHLAASFTAVDVVIDPTDPDEATVITLVALRDGGEVRDEVRVTRRDGVWQVRTYHLAPAS